MQAHVLTGDVAALSDVRDDAAMPAARRLGIYHHAYRARLLETLRDTFGHTLLYLGDDWFDHLAGAFIERTPSTSPNLRWYGEGWHAWLAAELVEGSPMGSHQEVAELAQLDWTLRRAFDAADAPALSMQDLAAMAPEDWATVVLNPQPSLAVLNLRHNTLSLWHALDQDEEVPPSERLDEPVAVLVWRHDERPHFRSMAPIEAFAMEALVQGRSFAEICASMAERFADHDTAPMAGALLRRWVEEGALTKQA